MNHTTPLSKTDSDPSAAHEIPLGPNVVIHLRDGTVLGWPRATLSHWSCSALPSGDLLTLMFPEHKVTLEGRGLRPVLNWIEQGAPLDLQEHGERHESVYPSLRPYVRNARVEAREN